MDKEERIKTKEIYCTNKLMSKINFLHDNISFSTYHLHEDHCDVPPSIQAERHPTRQPTGAAGAGKQADHAGQQPRGPAAAEEAAITIVTAATAVTLVSGAAVSGVTSL